MVREKGRKTEYFAFSTIGRPIKLERKKKEGSEKKKI